MSDFMDPGGTLISSRVILPSVTASRCSAMASSSQPSTRRVSGSMTGQKYFTNGIKPPGRACAVRARRWESSSSTDFINGTRLSSSLGGSIDSLAHYHPNPSRECKAAAACFTGKLLPVLGCHTDHNQTCPQVFHDPYLAYTNVIR